MQRLKATAATCMYINIYLQWEVEFEGDRQSLSLSKVAQGYSSPQRFVTERRERTARQLWNESTVTKRTAKERQRAGCLMFALTKLLDGHTAVSILTSSILVGRFSNDINAFNWRDARELYLCYCCKQVQKHHSGSVGDLWSKFGFIHSSFCESGGILCPGDSWIFQMKSRSSH